MSNTDRQIYELGLQIKRLADETTSPSLQSNFWVGKQVKILCLDIVVRILTFTTEGITCLVVKSEHQEFIVRHHAFFPSTFAFIEWLE
jgi:hypothetical protein